MLSGVAITELGALVGPRTRGVHLVRIRVKLEKRGDGLWQTEFDQKYYVQVLMAGNTPAECYYVEGSGKLTLVKYESVTIPATTNPSVPSGRASFLITNPPNQPNVAFRPSGWDPLPTLAIPASPCSYKSINGEAACPVYDGPPSPAITAQGNRLIYSFQTNVSMGIGGGIIGGSYPPAYPFHIAGSSSPTPSPTYYLMNPMGFGSILIFRLLDSGGNPVREDAQMLADWFPEFGFIQGSRTLPPAHADVTYGENYNFGMGFSAGVGVMSPQPVAITPPPPPPPAPPPPPPPPAYSFLFVNWRAARGTVLHYIETPPLP